MDSAAFCKSLGQIWGSYQSFDSGETTERSDSVPGVKNKVRNPQSVASCGLEKKGDSWEHLERSFSTQPGHLNNLTKILIC